MGDQGTQILQTKKLAFRVCDVRWVVCSHNIVLMLISACKSSNKNFHNSIIPTQPIIMSISHFIKKKYFIHIYILLNFFSFSNVFSCSRTPFPCYLVSNFYFIIEGLLLGIKQIFFPVDHLTPAQKHL